MRLFFILMLLPGLGCEAGDTSPPPDCESFSGPSGSPCSFTGTCTFPPGPGGPIRECCSDSLSCVDGFAVYGEACFEGEREAGPWAACGSYLASGGVCTDGGLPGDPCNEASFGVCSTGEVREPGACMVEVACVGGLVADRCAPPPDTACIDQVDPPVDAVVCRNIGECAASAFCRREDDPSCVGACMDPMRACELDVDCGSGSRCEAFLLACSCGESTRCVANCATDANCDSGETCETDGSCAPVSCVEGYECPENTRCGSRGTIDAHSCARILCSMDSECDCGFCVLGECVSSLGICTLFMP